MQRDNDLDSNPPTSLAIPRQTQYSNPMLGPPDDDSILFRLHARVIWNRRWTILAIVLTLMTMIAINVFRQTPTFQAFGTLEIEMPTKSVTSIDAFFPSEYVTESYLQTQAKILSSAALTNKVLENLNLWGRKASAASLLHRSYQEMFQERLYVSVVKGSALIQVTFRHEDPMLAAKTVNELMSAFIHQIQEERIENANEASNWMMGQVKEARAKLDESMDRLQRYEQDHQIVVVSPEMNQLISIDGDRLDQLEKELGTVELNRIEKEGIHKRILQGDTQMLESGFLVENLKTETALLVELQLLSSKYGPNWPDVLRTREKLKEVRDILAGERGRLSNEAEIDYQSAVEQETFIRKQIDEQRKTVKLRADQVVQENVLKHDVDLNEQAYEGLLGKLQEATNTATDKTVNAKIVDAAEPPPTSSYPGLVRNLIVGLGAGLAIGIIFVFMEELVRDTIKTPEEVESDLDLPLLGVVPAVKNIVINGNRRTEQTTTSFFAKRNRSKDKPQSGQWFRMDRDGKDNYQLAEAIRSLRTSIIFSIESHELKCLLFSSSIPDEGKTMISSNTSIALTQLGKRILMIDGDLRRPCLHKVFGTPNRRGLSEYLSEICEWEDVVQPSDVPGLDIITCGERPLNPAELLSSNRMSLIIHKAKSLYDLVILDSPTLLYMADSRILASYADSVVVIVRSRSTPTVLAKQACANVRGANTPILGVVLNRLEMGDSTYSYSDYSYPQPASQQ